MAVILAIVGVVSLIASGFAAASIRTDIQLGIMFNTFVGAITLFGLAVLVSESKKILRRIEELQAAVHRQEEPASAPAAKLAGRIQAFDHPA